jgi:large subunit ribosomal protein L3
MTTTPTGARRAVAGLLGAKLGMTQVWDEAGRLVPVTVVQAGPCVVTQVRTPETDGYSGVQLAFGAIDPRKVNQPLTGHFAKAGVTPRRHVAELRTPDAGDYTLGQELTAELFTAGQVIDVTGTTRGMGFAGVVKRHHMKGAARDSASSHEHHRHMGAVGQRKTPGRVFKGKRMPGHMGVDRRTVQNLTVVEVVPENNLILISGSVPGHDKSVVILRPAVK